MSNTIVFAIHDFKAENEDELSFSLGEPIMILEKDDRYMDGWWQGRKMNGETGLFPKSYASPEKPIMNPPDPQKLFKEYLQPEQDQMVTSSVVEIVSQLQVASPSEVLSDMSMKPEEWTVQQVANWLHSVGLGIVSNNFIDQEITGDILLDLNIDTLKELGITTFGKRYKIMQAIQTLKEKDIKPPTPYVSVSTGAISVKPSTLKRSSSQSQRPFNNIDRPISPQSLSSSGISRSNTISSEDKRPSRIMYHDTPLTPIPSISTPTQSIDAHKLSLGFSDELRASTTEYFEAPEYEGWLHKQSDKYKTWNRRWFVLKGVNLFYFKSPKDVRMKGIINLRGYKIIVDESIHAGNYCFKLQHDHERTFYFYTETEEPMREWIKMLMKTTIARDFRAPVMSSSQISTVTLDIARRMRPRPPSAIMYKTQKSKSTPTRQLHEPIIMEEQHPPHMEITYKEEEDEEDDLIDPHHKTVPRVLRSSSCTDN